MSFTARCNDEVCGVVENECSCMTIYSQNMTQPLQEMVVFRVFCSRKYKLNIKYNIGTVDNHKESIYVVGLARSIHIGVGRVSIRVLSGVKFLGGNLHIYLYVRMYIHTCMARRSVAWRKHDVVYSMILKATLMHAACISGFLSE